MRLLDRNDADPPTFEVTFRDLASSDSPGEKKYGSMILDLLDHLRDHEDNFTVWCHEFDRRQLSLIFESSSPIEVAVDFMDRSPYTDGHPPFHFRLTYFPPQHDSSNWRRIEKRTREVQEATDFILNLIREFDDN